MNPLGSLCSPLSLHLSWSYRSFLTLPFPLILHSPRVSPAERAAFGRTRGEWGWGREKDTERNDQRE